MTAILQGTLGGYRDHAIRTVPVRSPHSPTDRSPGTILTSREVAAVTRPPRDEVPGLQITDYAKFDTHVEIPSGDSVVLGQVLDFPNVPVGTSLNSLSSHALITGKTGAGKTTAIWHLLRSLTDHKIPFLVIEPAKREYRALPLHDLRIFTVGDSRTNSMRLNPFEVPKGVLPQTHIEHLVALFSAAFVLWPPLPEVLELSIPAIYEDLGIDLGSPPPEETTFPTLTDLFCKVNSIASTLGYGEEVERNIRAGLLTRIETLRRGSKGAMLDHSDPFDDEAFLSMRAIVELHHIGDNQVKALLMGLLLLQAFEHRQSAITNGSQALKHVTLVEEAHRLLVHHNQTSHSEMGNPALHGVQQFANMLAEARAAERGSS